jgi:hypothetical protein
VSFVKKLLKKLSKKMSIQGDHAYNNFRTNQILTASRIVAKSIAADSVFVKDVLSFDGTPIGGNTGVTAGSYTNASITVNSKGLVTNASSGVSGGVTTTNPPTVTNTISLFADTTGNSIRQQQKLNTDIAMAQGPLSASSVSSADNSNVCFGAGTFGAASVAGGSLTDGGNFQNTLIGVGAAATLNNGSDNVCLGYNAATAATDLTNSIFIGSRAGENLTSAGDTNIVIGKTALGNSTTVGASNILIGAGAGQNVQGIGNIMIGQNSTLLSGGTTGNGNIGVGNNMFELTTGSGNIDIGNNSASASITTGVNNILIGNHTVVDTKSNNIVIGVGNGPAVTSSNGNSNCILINSSQDTELKASAANQLNIQLESTHSLRTQFNTGTTVGAAGPASALPATPLGYLSLTLNGTSVVIPFYTAP